MFGLPQPVKRVLAGRRVERDGQVLDLDLQLFGRIDVLLASSAGGTVDQAALAEQRRQADLAAEVVAAAGLDDVVTEDL
ncbi:MAG TPA: hypothetical protein VFE39_11975 [Pseudonocardia sp.]|jgi:acetyl esterase|nr:hypothetical protein [Pseudonocardia sp.]